MSLPLCVHATTYVVPQTLDITATIEMPYEFDFVPTNERPYSNRCMLDGSFINTTKVITSEAEMQSYISSLPTDNSRTYVLMVWPTSLNEDARLSVAGKFVYMDLNSVTTPKHVGWCITRGCINQSGVQIIAFRSDWTDMVFADTNLILPDWSVNDYDEVQSAEPHC